MRVDIWRCDCWILEKKIGSDLQVRGNVHRVREAPDEEQ